MIPLPGGFIERPFAHRGLHDRLAGRIENSASAVSAAVATGYAVEIDVQVSADGQAMVFHDDDLDRLTAAHGATSNRSADDLSRLVLAGGTDKIPRLPTILDLVAGRVPLLIEVKDTSGTLCATDGVLEAAVAIALRHYDGPVAVMSFNPNAVREVRAAAPTVPVGLATCRFAPEDWPHVPESRLSRLAAVSDFASVGAAFISHDHEHLHDPPVLRLKERGASILCWTVRSPAEEQAAHTVADAVTFEGYLPDLQPLRP